LKKLLALITKLEPEANAQYQEFLKMAKENFQFDLEAFIEKNRFGGEDAHAK
jgi:hypothetical protein